MFRRFALSALLISAAACGDDTTAPAADAGPKDAGTTTGTDSGVKPYVVVKDKVTNVGKACTTATVATDCTSAAPTGTVGASCLATGMFATFPAGYCSAVCQDDSECGTNGACPFSGIVTSPLLSAIPQAAALVGNISTCFEKCTAASDCRTTDGYKCSALADAFPALAQLPAGIVTIPTGTFCLPPPAADAGVGTVDGGAHDAGATDAGTSDAGESDAAVVDAATGDAASN